ncbi:MAG: hypothetical protein HQL65_12465 [Magnetococcales bacterium]|nr:hypothetical protein [Magnetococcales bacterium]MBF0155222.1 hypothetical protein [Magnetococcales bacterium]
MNLAPNGLYSKSPWKWDALKTQWQFVTDNTATDNIEPYLIPKPPPLKKGSLEELARKIDNSIDYESTPDPEKIHHPIYPEGIDLDKNVQEAWDNKWNIRWFKSQVENKGPKDYKQLGRQYENFGNFHYGVYGKAAGIPDSVLLRAAGWAQQRSGTQPEDHDWGHWYGSEP